jgi:predicted Zn finger-like uncharacterized protein
MRIECPNCKLSGNLDESTVPATGLAMNCPRCKTGFTVERPSHGNALSGAMMDSCPQCQYATFSDEKFSVCPKCGLVVAEYHQKQLAARQAGRGSQPESRAPRPRSEQTMPPVRLSDEQRRKEEDARRKYGLDKVPGTVEAAEPAPVKVAVAEAPFPVLLIGWVTILAGLALVIYGGTGIAEYLARSRDAAAALQAGDEAATPVDLMVRFALFPVLTIVYALVMTLFGSQFLCRRAWAVGAMNSGALAGMVLGGAMELTDVIAWFRRASDSAAIGYYLTGLAGGLLMVALWIVPLLVLREYLRSDQFDRIKGQFS